VAPAVGGASGRLRTVAFRRGTDPQSNPAEERDVTQNDPVAPGAIAPGSTPASAASTGDPRVDQALGRLGELADLPLPEHAAVFEHVHAELTGALGTLDPGNDHFPQAPIASAQIPPAAAAHGTHPAPDS
jgi:hypothetical protein